jgi:hypothetical protein
MNLKRYRWYRIGFTSPAPEQRNHDPIEVLGGSWEEGAPTQSAARVGQVRAHAIRCLDLSHRNGSIG